jgi:hypothetical protein
LPEAIGLPAAAWRAQKGRSKPAEGSSAHPTDTVTPSLYARILGARMGPSNSAWSPLEAAQAELRQAQEAASELRQARDSPAGEGPPTPRLGRLAGAVM